jgi:hypothetical protein
MRSFHHDQSPTGRGTRQLLRLLTTREAGRLLLPMMMPTTTMIGT